MLRFLLLAVMLPALALAGCTPREAPPGPGLDVHGLNGAAFTEHTYITADGSELPLRSWQPPEGRTASGVVLALHGFNDYSHAFADSGAALAAQGLIVYAYDQRGFGEAPHRGMWPGVAVLTGDLTGAVALLRSRHTGLPIFLLGESMGGAVVLAALSGPEPPTVDGAILAAPAVWGRSTMPFTQRAALWFGARLFPWARFTGRGLGIQASDNIEMLRGLGRDPLFIKETRVDAIYGLVNLMDRALQAGPKIETDLLLLYGERDQVVPADPILRFWSSLSEEAPGRRRLALYAEGWHMLLRDLQAQVVIDDIAAWTRDREAPLPSPAEEYAAALLARLAAEGEIEAPRQTPRSPTETASEQTGAMAGSDAASVACDAPGC